MTSNTFTVENLEFYLLVLARISAFIFSAPVFSQKNIPRRIKVLFSVVLAFVVFTALDYKEVEYNGVIDFGILIVTEVVAGLILGFVANICVMILTFAGNLVDMEIGFSMAQEMNNVNNVTSTITGNYYTYMVMLVMLVSDMHLYILKAIVDSFNIIELGKVSIGMDIYVVLLKFLVEYFIIAFRIILPIFTAMLITNTVLGILAKAAPQMNMFVVGMQLKVVIGLAVLFFTASTIGNVTNFIFEEMKVMMKSAIVYLK